MNCDHRPHEIQIGVAGKAYDGVSGTVVRTFGDVNMTDGICEVLEKACLSDSVSCAVIGYRPRAGGSVWSDGAKGIKSSLFGPQ